MIQNLKIYPIFNSAGRETIMVKVTTDSGFYTASVPSGKSKGASEAKELPVKSVLKIFSKIRPKLITLDEKDWKGLDSLLQKIDGTKNFSKIGGNLALAISVAVAKAATGGNLWKLNQKGFSAEFPLPIANIIGGGAHGGGTDWQEFLIIPTLAKNPQDAMKTILEIWGSAGEELKRKKLLVGRNIEGAWTTKLNDVKTLDFLTQIANDFDVKIGIDCASTTLWNGKVYKYKKMGKSLNHSKQLDFIREIVESYKVYYLEDPLHQDDFWSFSSLTSQIREKTLVVGDDLYCTNPNRLKKGIKQKATNGIIIKPNQIGTLSQAQQVVALAKENKIIPTAAHRSGETADTWISDLAITWDTPIIKVGLADIPKYNRLIELWEEIPEVKMAELPL